MGLLLKFNVCKTSNCESLKFTELTGLYNVTTNSTGYGTPNPNTTDATAAILVITNGSGASYTIDMLTTGLFPSSDTTLSYTIPNEAFGYVTGNKIPDQMLTLTYTVTFDSISYKQIIYVALFCQVKCCVLKMPISIDWSCCDCNRTKIDNFFTAYGLLNGLEASAKCSNITAFNNQLTALQKICTTGNCGCK